MEENEERTLYENLEYLNETKGIIKQAIIDKGVEISADTPFREYADKISDITTGEDLEEELSAQEQVIQQMKIALENKTAGGKVKLNIYAQTAEPEGKDGIWLETNKEFEKVYFDEQVKRIEVEGWDTTKEYPTYHTGSSNYHTSAIVDNYIYIFASSNVSRYNIQTNEIETNIASVSPYSFTYSTGTCTVGSDIYLCGSNNSSNYNSTLFKFDTTTNTISIIGNLARFARILNIDNYIYSFGTNNGSTSICRLDLQSNTVETVTTNAPINMGSPIYTSVVNIGHIVYIFGQYSSSSSYYKYSYKYDVDTNTFTRIADLDRVMYIRSCAVDNYIYLFGVDQQISYKYDVVNDTYTTLTTKKFGTEGRICLLV